ncbi:DUF4123 domain-containing protein [Vibrio viridaestus]|uniref:DUF4123 domain-containing protein n=1 Tax=Vibrio viridaestus TaxID=2487322 RepID=A0A3N9TL67_9VIBR|nr:DUF4123 domain-containing protein [Vibrio viridaestus]RQW65020.1 DUF4123 domain-containing protein [Vibrio viridaestus]
MKKLLDEWVPDIDTSQPNDLYLFVDAGQIEQFAQKIYRVPGEIDLEPIYMLPPYDHLREVSPYIVKVTDSVKEWFIEQNSVTAGFFFSSQFEIDDLCEHFRQCIKVMTPYGSKVFLKMAQSEAACALLENDNPHFWFMLEQAWLPTRAGWKELDKPEHLENEIQWPLVLTESVWQEFGQIAWLTSLEGVQEHIQNYFPHLTDYSDFNRWLKEKAKEAYDQGFTSIQDLLFFFNIIGYLGEEAVYTNQYPDIYQLITSPSVRTPSQRIEQAAKLAYEYSQSMSNEQEQ